MSNKIESDALFNFDDNENGKHNDSDEIVHGIALYLTKKGQCFIDTEVTHAESGKTIKIENVPLTAMDYMSRELSYMLLKYRLLQDIEIEAEDE